MGVIGVNPAAFSLRKNYAGARYDATEVMQGVTEVLAYGTAVFVEPAK
jgi:hypothetical protein